MPPTLATPPAPVRRSQAQRRDESERLLMQATLSIVAGRGVSAATFEEIGREAGYSRGLATQRFGSKRGLTEAVIAHLHGRSEAILEAEHIAELPALDAIVQYMENHGRFLTREHGGKAYFMLLAAAVADADSLRDLFAASHDRVRDWLKAIIARGQSQGQISDRVDAEAAALMVGSLLLGLSTQWLVDPETPVQRILETSVATIRAALAPRP